MSQNHIIRNINANTYPCFSKCEGSYISSFMKTKLSEDLDVKNYLNEFVKQYKNYKSTYMFPDKLSYLNTKDWTEELKMIIIKFDTPTFDRITKDKSSKFVDQLSAIGGTMGLLTGFSIISAVEILYFATKILFNVSK